jgi:putative PIN family toxin of toxin-antitoxin system
MIRAVLDTNVLACGATHAQGPSGRIVLAWRRRAFALVTSEHILDELEATLEGRYFMKHLTGRERQGLVARIRRHTWLTDITVRPSGIRLKGPDALVLATAMSGGAEYVVTGDEQFQAVDSYGGILIVSPRRFLEVLSTLA